MQTMNGTWKGIEVEILAIQAGELMLIQNANGLVKFVPMHEVEIQWVSVLDEIKEKYNVEEKQAV